MTAYTTWLDGTSSVLQGGGNYASTPGYVVLTAVYDATRRPLASTDTIRILTIPAGTWVARVWTTVITADSGVGINVGDATDPNGWVADADVGTAGNQALGAGAYAAAIKQYSAETPLIIECVSGDAYDTLKVRITVECVIP